MEKENHHPKWVSHQELPLFIITLVSVCGEVLFSGEVDDLVKQLRTGFALGRSLVGIHPVYIIGTSSAKSLAALFFKIDFTLPNHTYTVVFQPGRCNLMDCSPLLKVKLRSGFGPSPALHQFYEVTGLVTALDDETYSFPSYRYARKDTIPDSWAQDFMGRFQPLKYISPDWKKDAAGIWGPASLRFAY